MLTPILIKGTIWTHDGMQDWMSFQAGFITALGKGSPPQEVIAKSRVLTLAEDEYILPGLIDSHIHISMVTLYSTICCDYLYGESLIGSTDQVSLKHCNSLESLISSMKESDGPHKKWLIGHGWCQEKLGIGDKMFDHSVVDKISAEKPVILYRNCYHLCVVNNFMLDLFGISGKRDSLEKNGWNIDILSAVSADFQKQMDKEKDRETLTMIDRRPDGTFTGIIRETMLFHIKKFLYHHLPVKIKKSYFVEALKECSRKGLTTVQSNDFFGAWMIYRELTNEGKVPIRVFLTIPFDEAIIDDDDDVPVPDDQIGLVGFHRIKLFADGSLGAKTAALREPYHDNCNHNKGILIDTEEELAEKITTAKGKGLRLEIHVIGDEATSTVLRAIEKAGVSREERPILTHCQILGKDLISKMKAMNVIANVQPSFVVSDANFATKRLGNDSERFKYSYAWKTMISEGVNVTGGSDAPVEDCNPFLGIHAAIFRTWGPNDGRKPSEMNVFHKHERLTFSEAIDLYTRKGAYTAGEEDRIGQLKKGYMADFIVINKKIWESSYERVDETWNLLREVQVKQMWVNGENVFGEL